jgi:hypothetical protein
VKAILPNVPLEQYIADAFHDGPPSLSASTAHCLLTKSAKHAWLRSPRLNPGGARDESDAADLGTLAHALFLENDRSRVCIIPADDYRTKVARELRDTARANGQLPILAHRMADVEQMVDAMRDALAASELAGIAVDAKIEHTLVFDLDGVRHRCRPDLIDGAGMVLLDVKTTAGSAEPHAWARGPLLANGYDLQAAMMLTGANAVLGPAERRAVFMVVESTAPYAVSFVGLAPMFVDFAFRKLAVARERWKACLEENRWPGYPQYVAWADPPSYATYAWEERQAIAPPPDDDPEDAMPISDLLFGRKA